MSTILRHGLMLVGPTGGGKTSNYNCLKVWPSQSSTGFDDVYGQGSGEDEVQWARR